MKKEEKEKIVENLMKLLYSKTKDITRYAQDKEFISTHLEEVSKLYHKSAHRAADDHDRILRKCIDSAKQKTYFKMLHPESKNGRKSHEEALDERFIGKHLKEFEDEMQKTSNIKTAFQNIKSRIVKKDSLDLDDSDR